MSFDLDNIVSLRVFLRKPQVHLDVWILIYIVNAMTWRINKVLFKEHKGAYVLENALEANHMILGSLQM